jgi:hypothetical protein
VEASDTDDMMTMMMVTLTWHGRRPCQVRTSTRTPLLTVLLEGRVASGKTALAASVAVESTFPFVRVISQDNMIGMGESQKVRRGRWTDRPGRHVIRVLNQAWRFQFHDFIVSPSSSLISLGRLTFVRHYTGRVADGLACGCVVVRPWPSRRPSRTRGARRCPSSCSTTWSGSSTTRPSDHASPTRYDR